MTNYYLILITSFILVLFLAGFTSALGVQLLCLKKGETVRFSQCNPNIPDRTCTSSRPTAECQYCVNQLPSGAYCPVSLSLCRSSGECTELQNQTEQNSISLLSPPDSYSTNSTSTLDFVYDVSNPNNIKYCKLLVNNVIKRTNSTAILPTSNVFSYTFIPGNYTWKIICWDKTNIQITSLVRRLTMLPVQNNTNSTTPQDTQQNFPVILLNPLNNAISATFPINISFDYKFRNLTTVKRCDLILNNTVVASNSTAISRNSTNSIIKELSEGNYTWSISCIKSGAITINSTSMNFVISLPTPEPPAPPVNNGGGGGGGGSYTPPKQNNTTNLTQIQTQPLNLTQLSASTNKSENISSQENLTTQNIKESSPAGITGAMISVRDTIKSHIVLTVVIFGMLLGLGSVIIPAIRKRKEVF